MNLNSTSASGNIYFSVYRCHDYLQWDLFRRRSIPNGNMKSLRLGPSFPKYAGFTRSFVSDQHKDSTRAKMSHFELPVK